MSLLLLSLNDTLLPSVNLVIWSGTVNSLSLSNVNTFIVSSV
jgi:hypothetical protein